MEIKILNPVYSRIMEKQYIPLISKFLSFQTEFWLRVSIKDKNGIPTGRFKKERRSYLKSMVLPSGTFFTGHVPKVVEFLRGKGIQATTAQAEWPFTATSPKIPLKLRPDQENLVAKAVDSHTGIIKAPTGFGKTILAGAIISSIKDIKTLFLCHTITLVHQTIKSFEGLGLDVGYITGTSKKLTGEVIVATVQSFHKQPQELFDSFDMVIVDEAHHLAGIGGLYYKTLTRLLAPYRYGLTATLPTGEETKLLAEGLIGKLIDEYTLTDGIQGGILAVPKIKIVKIPIDFKVRELRKYTEVYDQGVVFNRSRNRAIIKIAKEISDKGGSCLILVTKIEHGAALLEMAELLKHPVVFLQGKDEGFVREQIRESLNKKETKTVIATTIFKEGVDVPTLDCVINAAGGKSEIAVLQGIGRGLRATAEKDSVLIVDFLDLSHHYLIAHFGERLAIYSAMDWL
jgi:superfamily II DNA or RNA helicase